MNYSELVENIFTEYGYNWLDKLSKIKKNYRPMKIDNYYQAYYIVINPNMQYNMIREHLNENNVGIYSRNENLTWKIIKNNLHLKWEWSYISEHKNITWKIISENPQYPWKPIFVSRNPNITFDIIINNPTYNWCWENVFHNNNLTWENIKYIMSILPEISSNSMSSISLNANITCDIVRNNPDIKWDWYYLGLNPNINIDFVKENFEKFNKALAWALISKNKNITWKNICDNPDVPWDWTGISENPNVTWEIISNNLDEPWNWNCILSNNPNITFEIFLDNLDSVFMYHSNWFHLNHLTLDRDMYIRKKLREWFKKSELKEELIAKLWHPRNYEKFKYYDPDTFETD